ncbi:MAG: bifunctional phosphopantothenoylcysteine decarboxylase/phosphopantothenate--cysteine ligase CoaBC [Nitrososphaerota archaeon]
MSTLGIRGSYGHELKGKKIALCITSSVSCYRAPDIARLLIRHGAEVIPVMTRDAARLISPEILKWATGNEPIVEITGKTEHVMLTETESRVDLVLIAPATANTIGKIASGISDNSVTLLASCALGAGIPIIIVPAAHETMIFNPLLTRAIRILRDAGIKIIEPAMEEGKAKLRSPEDIVETVMETLMPKPLIGRRFIVTAGPTREKIDDVRFITNASSGKMGIEIARQLKYLGAEVTLIHGPITEKVPPGINTIKITSAEELTSRLVEETMRVRADAVFAVAAVTDFKPIEPMRGKLDSRTSEIINLQLVRNRKAIQELRKASPTVDIIAFRAVYGDVEDPVAELKKLQSEAGVMMVVINDISRKEVGFGSDLNEVTIVTSSQKIIKTGLRPKRDIAKVIVETYIEEKAKTPA